MAVFGEFDEEKSIALRQEHPIEAWGCVVDVCVCAVLIECKPWPTYQIKSSLPSVLEEAIQIQHTDPPPSLLTEDTLDSITPLLLYRVAMSSQRDGLRLERRVEVTLNSGRQRWNLWPSCKNIFTRILSFFCTEPPQIQQTLLTSDNRVCVCVCVASVNTVVSTCAYICIIMFQ